MNTWEKIGERLTLLDSFYKQVDGVRKRLNLEEYKFTDFDGKTPVEKAIVVTENKSITYMNRIIESLQSSEWQDVVEGDISKKACQVIEKFLARAWEEMDEYLFEEQGIVSLNAWLCKHACHTSLIGVQVLSSIEGDEYKIPCLPIDMRWCPFVPNKWAAPITYLNKDELLKKFDKFEEIAKREGFTFTRPEKLGDSDNEVRDYWDDKVNELWVTEQLIFSRPNIYGQTFVTVWVPSGYMFRGRDHLKYESLSPLFPNQNLYDQLSRQLSIDATLGFKSVFGEYEYEYETPPKDGVSEPAPDTGETLARRKGELHRLVERPDINIAQRQSIGEINKLIDEATPILPRAYTQPPSSLEFVGEQEALDDLLTSRIIALKMFRQQLARLLIQQFLLLTGGDSKAGFSVGKQGKKMTFAVPDLKDPNKYSISCEMMKENKRLAIINESRALAAWGKAPTEYILRDIWQVQDPDGWMRAMELQKAKEANPALGVLDMAIRYAEEAEDLADIEKDLKNWQSIMLQHDYIMLMRQKLQPAMPSEPQKLRETLKETSNAQGLASLGGQIGGGLPRLEKEVATE